MPRRRKPTRASEHRALLNTVDYEGLLAFQGGVCAICGGPPKTRRLDRDHDHKSMEVRGLLCVRCNRNVPDWVSPEWLDACAAYLRNPPYPRFVEADHLVQGA